MSTSPREGAGRLLGLAGLVLLVVGLLGLWTFRRFVAVPPAAVPPAAAVEAAPAGAEPSAPRALVVTALEGTVERGSAGSWQAVRLGEVVSADQSLRTAPLARAELSAAGSGARLRIAERSELSVSELSRDSHRFLLTRGRVQVDYEQEGARLVRVESQSGTVAETSGARFWMLASGTVVAVAAERGLVNLSAAGGAVELREGQQSVVMDGQAPEAPTAVPVDVLLSVARTQQKRGACAVVEGRVRPGSELRVDGEPVIVVADGRFKLVLPQRPGARAAVLSVHEPSGATREQRIACIEAAEPADPEASVHIDWTQ